MAGMPPKPEPSQKSPHPAATVVQTYPIEAFEFMHEGLDYTVNRVHGPVKNDGKENRHVSGQQLCEGLRELALSRWGRLARTVLRRWDIHSTLDFGRMVYSLIETGQLQKVEEDSIDDFRNVYDFERVLERDYKIPSQPSQA